MLALVLVVAVRGIAPADVVNLTTTANDVEVSWDRRTVTLRGNAELYGQSEQDPSKWVRVTAELIEGDLITGRFEALGDVLMVTEQAALRGESLALNARTSQFQLRRGGLVAEFEYQPGEPLCGFAYGRELSSEGHVVHLLGARFTTCERVNPHWSIEARELKLDTQTNRLEVRDAALRLYGVRIPVIPYFWYDVVEGGPARSSLIPDTLFSGRDGLTLAWGLPINIPERQITSTGAVRLTSRRGLRANLDLQGPVGGMTGHLRGSFKEDVISDLDVSTLVDRRPELALLDTWQSDLFGGTEVGAEVAVGSYKEHGVDGAPDVYDERALASVRLGQNFEARKAGIGQWWWVGATEQFYRRSGDYTVLEAGVGAGRQFTDWFRGWATYTHRYTRGASPFEFDDVDLFREVTAGTRLDLDENWSVRATGRYDLQFGAMRDYRLELARRFHCLTWKVGYRGLTGGISVGVAINGVSPGEPSCQHWAVSDGPPDVWSLEPAEETPVTVDDTETDSAIPE